MKNLIKNMPFMGDVLTSLYGFYLRMLPDEVYIRREWKSVFGNKELNLENPRTYNEKLQWEKLHSYNELAVKCADKVGVLGYVKEEVGSEYINEAYGIYNDVSEINFDELPSQFVVKASHDSGSVLIVKDKSQIDLNKLDQINKSLKINFGKQSREWVYNNIQPKILVERFMDDERFL